MINVSRLLIVLSLLLVTGCQSAYYGAMEKMGIHKRDILVDRVEDGRDAQQEAKEQFQTALEAFRSLEDFDGGDLEEVYNRLKGQFEASESRVEEVRDRVESIEKVATDLFSEWEGELDQFDSAELRRSSQKTLDGTKDRYTDLITAMRKAESKMEPVLKVFGDRVLYLKHNLNASAISSLQAARTEIEGAVGGLITEMEASIAEADAFIAEMDAEDA